MQTAFPAMLSCSFMSRDEYVFVFFLIVPFT